MRKDFRQCSISAFTLAEVLITLAVIGIVAVLTLPTLIQRHQERVKVTQLKKTYAVLQQAFQMAIAEHGTLEKWGLGDTVQGTDEDGNTIVSNSPQEKVIAYISPYLKKSEGSVVYNRTLALDGRVLVSLPTVVKNETGAPTSLILADGTYIQPGWQTGACSRGPNHDVCGDLFVSLPYSDLKSGVTHFNFHLTRNGLLGCGYNGDTLYPFSRDCDVKNKSGMVSYMQGRGCTAWVLEKGNMEFLHCDDLSWSGKTKCSDK